MGFSISKALSKLTKLDKISKNLSSSSTSADDLFNNNKGQALEQLLDLCESDPDICKIMSNHNISREHLKMLYVNLNMFGAGQWVGNDYVSASTICHWQTLDYLLRKSEKSDDQIYIVNPEETVYRIMKYFEEEEIGQIKD